MTNLPNPFQSAICPQVAEEAAASPIITPGSVGAAAEPFDPYGPLDAWTIIALGRDLDDHGGNDHRFVIDEVAFFEAIEPLPLLLQAPLDVLSVLAGYAR